MLKLLLGTAKSGKTRAIYQRLAQVPSTEHAVLIVPEQASFVNEKNLSRYSPQVEVLSFKRLCALVLKATGQQEKKPLSEAAAAILMSVALEEVGDALSVYARNYKSRGFVEQLVALSRECKNSGVTPERLATFSLGCKEGALKEKSYELSLILDAFSAAVGQEFFDEGDNLSLCARRIAAHPELFCEISIFIDDFASFTAPQLAVIEALLQTGKAMTVALCSDAEKSECAAFAVSNQTASKLKYMALKLELDYVCEQVVRPVGLVPPALEALEQCARNFSVPQAAVPSAQVVAYAAENLHDELCFVAANAAALAAAGMRYRDMAVVARNLGDYAALIPSVFGRYALPYFIDAQKDARSRALSFAVIAALRVAAGISGDLCDLAKTPLMGVDPALAGAFENYCYVWSLDAAKQLKPFENHPDGMAGELDAAAQSRLEQLEVLRQQLAAQVTQLKKALEQRSGKAFAQAVYAFIEESGIKQNVTQLAADLDPAQKELFFSEQTLLWSGICDILDLFFALPESAALEPKRMVWLFELALSFSDVATVPQSLDEVLVGTADRMRTHEVKVVFVLGAADGVFPGISGENPLFPESDRKELRASGVPIMGLDDADSLEAMLCYRALTAAAEKVFVSFSKATPTGEAAVGSRLFDLAAPFSEPFPNEEFWRVQTPESARFELALRLAQGGEPLAIIQSVCAKVLGAQAVDSLKKSVEKQRFRITQPALAQRLFGKTLRLSPSALERYYSCPFSYFAQSGLKLRPRKKATLSMLEAGTLIHYVLEKSVSEHGIKALAALSPPELRRLTRDLAMRYLNERAGDTGVLPKRVVAGFERISEWLFELLVQLVRQFENSVFEPCAFELKIAREGEVAPLMLTTADGATIFVEGSVDRVDVATVGGKKYIRVVDYKSGHRDFLLSDVFYGLNMQMLVYLFSIWQNGSDAFADVLPAGVLYQTSLGKYISSDRAELMAAFEKKKQKLYKMDGLLLDDEAVLQAMELDQSGVFIPTAEKNLASLAEMGRLKRLVESRIEGMAASLFEGNVAALPAVGTRNPCDFCDYRGVCLFETGDDTAALDRVSRDKILEEVQDDGER